MKSFGLRHGPPDVIAAIGRGETVDPATYYFRTTPRFETAHPSYAFLNRLRRRGQRRTPRRGSHLHDPRSPLTRVTWTGMVSSEHPALPSSRRVRPLRAHGLALERKLSMNSRPLMILRLTTTSPQQIGATPHGKVSIFPVTGGSFEGSRRPRRSTRSSTGSSPSASAKSALEDRFMLSKRFCHAR